MNNIPVCNEYLWPGAKVVEAEMGQKEGTNAYIQFRNRDNAALSHTAKLSNQTEQSGVEKKKKSRDLLCSRRSKVTVAPTNLKIQTEEAPQCIKWLGAHLEFV